MHAASPSPQVLAEQYKQAGLFNNVKPRNCKHRTNKVCAPAPQVLAELYKQAGRLDLSLAIHLQLRSPAVFEFIEDHGLWAGLKRKAGALLRIDAERALALMVAHYDALPPAAAVPCLQVRCAVGVLGCGRPLGWQHSCCTSYIPI